MTGLRNNLAEQEIDRHLMSLQLRRQARSQVAMGKKQAQGNAIEKTVE